MVNRFHRRFFFLLLAVLAVSAVLSVAGHVTNAAIGHGQAQSLAAQLLGGEGSNWVPRSAPAEEAQERFRRLRELANDGRYVMTPTHVFDPHRDEELPRIGVLNAAPANPSKRGGTYYWVQFEGDRATPADRERIRSVGAEFVRPLAVHAAVVRANPMQIEQLASMPEVRDTSAWHPFYRVDRRLLALLSGEDEASYVDDKGHVTLLLWFFPGETPSHYTGDVRAAAPAAQLQVHDELPAQSRGGMSLTVDYRALPGIVNAVSRIGGVEIVEPWAQPVLMNEDKFWIHQTYDNDPAVDVAGRVHTNGVIGFRQVVAVVDTGLENDMCWFRYGIEPDQATFCQSLDPSDANNNSQPLDNVTDPCNKVIAYYINEGTNPAVCYDPSGGGIQHGTYVTGVIAADNFQTNAGGDGRSAFCELQNGDPVRINSENPPSVHRGPFGSGAGRWDGIAPGAQLVIQDRGRGDTSLNIEPFFTLTMAQAWDSGARYQNNSWGQTNVSSYSNTAAAVDNFLYARRTFNAVWASGNTGNNPSPSLGGFGPVAKNSIAVGQATTNGCAAGPAMCVFLGGASGSSKGETTDGRLKPDVMAQGHGVSANADFSSPARSINEPGNQECSVASVQTGASTSFAAPVVTGLAALIGQYFEDGFYPSGRASRGPWALPGYKAELDDGTPLQTDPNINPNADRCTTQPALCDPGTSFQPTNALVKAVLLNSSRNMTGTNTGRDPGTIDARPNAGQGWGLPVLDDTLFFEGDVGEPGGQRSGLLVLTDTPNGMRLSDPGVTELLDVRQDVFFRYEDAFSGQGDTQIKEWDVTILPDEPLIVTLCWSDQGDGWSEGDVLVNDLDLEVIGPNPRDPSFNIAIRPNPDNAYTGLNNERDGWVQVDPQLADNNGPAEIWLGKDGAPIPGDKNQWPEFPTFADHVNTCEQVALRGSDVVGGTYTVRVLPWRLEGPTNFVARPDLERDGRGEIARGTDVAEGGQQGFALILSGAFATDQGVLSFNQSTFSCRADSSGRLTLRDQNGCADPSPSVQVTTTTPDPSFPQDLEIFSLTPEFACDPGLPPEDEAQPKRFFTPDFDIVASNNPADVVQGDGIITLAPGQEIQSVYEDVDPVGGLSTARANLTCRASFIGDGFELDGGCDLTDPTRPEAPDNPKDPDQFMDAGELIEYTAFFVNTSNEDYTDVHATLSLLAEDPANPEAMILNNPVYVGDVPAGRRASATFLVQMADGPSITPQETITFEIALTSPGDSLVQPVTFEQTQKIESDVLEYRYNTRDPNGDLWGQGLIEELRGGFDLETAGPEGFVQYDDLLTDPGADGLYGTPDDGPSRNATNWPPEAQDPWDFDEEDGGDGFTQYVDPTLDGGVSNWIHRGSDTDDQSVAGGCGWNTTFETPVGESGIGIWHTGVTGFPQGIGPVHPDSSPVNMGPDPAFNDIFQAPNNGGGPNAQRVCATYSKTPDPNVGLYVWYLRAPRVFKVTTSAEFRVAWQRLTWYGRIFGHRETASNYSAFGMNVTNEPAPIQNFTFREADFGIANGTGVFASTVGQGEVAVLEDWNDPADNVWTENLAAPDATFPDRSFEDIFGPPSPDGWDLNIAYWLGRFDGTDVPNRYGMGVDDFQFIWTESRETDDQTDCALANQEAQVFFNQLRYNLCEGDLEISVVDPNLDPATPSVYVRVISDEEPIPGEIVKLRRSQTQQFRYDGSLPFTVDATEDIRGVLLVTAGQNDVAQGADTVFVQYDPREFDDPSNSGVGDFLDEGWPGCVGNDSPDGENDDFRLNCSVDFANLGDPTQMTEAADADGDTCPDGDGVADAEDDCDAVSGIDEVETGQDCSAITQNCPAGGIEANDFAFVNCPGGGVFYVSHEIVGGGDDDRYADRNEEVNVSVDLLNLRGDDLVDTTARISTEDDTICILDNESFYGDVIGVTNAQILSLEREEMITSTPPTHPVTGESNFFRIGVPPETITASLDAIQKARIRVDLFADNFSTSGTGFDAFAPLEFEMFLDLDEVPNGIQANPFFETFCDDSGTCAPPFAQGAVDDRQPWFTDSRFWVPDPSDLANGGPGSPGSGVMAIDATQVFPDNGGFCPECDFDSDTGCSTTPPPDGSDPACQFQFDGTQADIGTEELWHIETQGIGQPQLGTTKTGQWALHVGSHADFNVSNGQLSALVLPELFLSSESTEPAELRFWQIAEFWFPSFTSGLVTPIGEAQVQINTDQQNGYPETSWRRLDPWTGNYNTFTDALNACRGAFCGVHQPTFQAAGNWDDDTDANGTTLSGRWVESVVDLSEFRGQPIKLRFLVSVLQDISTPSGSGRGWVLDDITVTGLGNDGEVGYGLEADPLPEPGPCGLQAIFTVSPQATCQSSPVQLADRHLGLGESDGAGGRLPIAYEWDFDGDGTPEISCADGCLEGEDILADPAHLVDPLPGTIADVLGNCEAPQVTYAQTGNFSARMTLCQGGEVKDSTTSSVRVRPDLAGNVSTSVEPLIDKGTGSCPATAQGGNLDLNGDTVVDAADDAVYDADYIGCVAQGTRVRQEASVSGGARQLNFCWENQGAIVCADQMGLNFFRYDALGAFPDSVTVVDNSGGCSETVPLGMVVVPGGDICAGNITISDSSCGEAVDDGFINPGEYVRLEMEMQNCGDTSLVEPVAELRTTDPQVTVHRAASRLVSTTDPTGDFVLDPGETAIVTFEVQVSELRSVDGVIDFTVDVYTWDRTFDDTVNLTVPMCEVEQVAGSCVDDDLAGSISGNPFVCDPGNGNATSACPSASPAADCCPANQLFQTDSGVPSCPDGTIEDVCVIVDLEMFGADNEVNELNVTLLGPDGQQFPLLRGNPRGDVCQQAHIELCTSHTSRADEQSSLCGQKPDRDAATFYDDFREAFRNTTATGGAWSLRVEDARGTTSVQNLSYVTEVQSFQVDVDVTRTVAGCATVPVPDPNPCLTDDAGPIFGGVSSATGCSSVVVDWFGALDQMDSPDDLDSRADSIPMDYIVQRAETASCADLPAVGDFADLPGSPVTNMTSFQDVNVDPAAGAYWYRVVAEDGDDPGQRSDVGTPDNPNPDDADHWACVEIATLCPPPIPILGGSATRSGGIISFSTSADTSPFAGIRLYRGDISRIPGQTLDTTWQAGLRGHQIIDGAQGNCFEPSPNPDIQDDDTNAGNFGTGSFYYLMNVVTEPTPGAAFVEGSIDTVGFPGNSQAEERAPTGNHDCPQ